MYLPGEDAGFDLADQAAELGARLDPDGGGELVARQRGPRGPSRCQAIASGMTSRASSRWASIISAEAVGPAPRAESRSATVSSVTSAATGAVSRR